MKIQLASDETLGCQNHGPSPADASHSIAGAIVDVTHREWSTPLAQAQASPDSIHDTFNSPSELRDRFLNVLDSDDPPLLRRIALDLVRSRNPLPGMTCEKLGLPPRSTYGVAARHVLAHLQSLRRSARHGVETNEARFCGKGRYDVVVLVSPEPSRSTFETTFAIYRGKTRLFTGITPLEVTSIEDAERVGYAAARRWIDQRNQVPSYQRRVGTALASLEMLL